MSPVSEAFQTMKAYEPFMVSVFMPNLQSN